MPRYIEIAHIEEIPKNGMKTFNVGELEILLVNAEGEFYAVENKCPHMGYPLYLGSLEGTTLTCGFHQARFDITTGRAQGPTTQRPVRTFRIKTKNSRILIKL